MPAESLVRITYWILVREGAEEWLLPSATLRHPLQGTYLPVSGLQTGQGQSAGQVPRDWLCPCDLQASQLLLQLTVAFSQEVTDCLSGCHWVSLRMLLAVLSGYR